MDKFVKLGETLLATVQDGQLQFGRVNILHKGNFSSYNQNFIDDVVMMGKSLPVVLLALFFNLPAASKSLGTFKVCMYFGRMKELIAHKFSYLGWIRGWGEQIYWQKC